MKTFASEKFEDVASTFCLTHAFDSGLALFARQQRAELFATREDFVADLVQCVAARLNATGRPRRKGCARGTNRGLQLGDVRLRLLADDVAQI